MVAAETLGSLDAAKQVYERVADATTGVAPLSGASTFTFAYSDNVFSFTNFHSPIMGAIAGGSEKQQLYSTPSAGLLNLGDENVKQLKPIECLGGCLITDLQPRAFWAKLGFSSTHIDNNILFNDATYTAAGAVEKIKYLNSRRVRPNVLMSDYRSSLLPYVGNFGNVATFGAEEPAVRQYARESRQQTVYARVWWYCTRLHCHADMRLLPPPSF